MKEICKRIFLVDILQNYLFQNQRLSYIISFRYFKLRRNEKNFCLKENNTNLIETLKRFSSSIILDKNKNNFSLN